ncbi:MAG: hypothetical protein J5892_02350 [Bacilli bacterium]|nr:hypothetical protein [Bacilli bacterium]
MIISELTTGYKNSLKKIKKNYDAMDKLNKVLSHMEVVHDFKDLKNHVISDQYGFEELKGDLTGYYRFSIDKNSKSGKLRLLFSCPDNYSIRLEYISDEHYEDFKRYLRNI